MDFWGNSDLRKKYQHLTDRAEIVQQILAIIEPSPFKWKVYGVAATGFFTDAYNLFATNVIYPALAFVYWPGYNSDTHNLVINEATLLGSGLGMLLFGNLADRYGRQNLYGIELGIVIIATIGLTQASSGYDNESMNIYPWIVFWRFILGIGIGAEYPLSALIAAEWSSTKSRGKMLAAVFLMQPLGQLAAYVVGISVLVGISSDRGLSPGETDQHAAGRVIDMVWRCIIGVGGVPALIAIAARLSIPETPRYLLEIEGNAPLALAAIDTVYKPTDNELAAHKEKSVLNKDRKRAEAEKGVAGVASNRPNKSSDDTEDRVIEMDPDDPIKNFGNTEIGVAETVTNRPTDNSEDSNKENKAGAKKKRFPQFTWKEWNKFLGEKGYGRILAGTSICWFLLDVCFYGLGLDNPRTIAKFWASKPTDTSNLPNWSADFANQNDTIYEALKGDYVRALYTIPITSIFGSVLILLAINYIPRAAFLTGTFLALAVIFLIAGGSLIGVYDTDQHGVAIVFYSLALFVANFGPNSLTFILPAELFPTKYRGTCYGIAAASGKLGACIIQIIVHFAGVTDPEKGKKPLYIMFLAFCPLMLLGALFAWVWIPEVQQSRGQDGEKDDHAAKYRSFKDRMTYPSISLEAIAENPTKGQTFGFRDNIRKRIFGLEPRSAVLGNPPNGA